MTRPYDTAQPERSAVDALPGVVALDFGTNWCGYCNAAQGTIEAALQPCAVRSPAQSSASCWAPASTAASASAN